MSNVNMVTVTEAKLEACFVKLGYPEDIAKGHAEYCTKILPLFVPAQYQAELDYYIETQEVMENERAEEIKDAMQFLPCHYFEALYQIVNGGGV